MINRRKPSSGSVTVNGVTARRTCKATRNKTQANALVALSVEEMRATAYELRLAYVSTKDIAAALQVSRSRVSQLLHDQTKLQTEEWQRTADEWRLEEIERIDDFIGHWAQRAQTDPKAADVLRTWCERKDRLLGLYVNRTELSGPNGGPIRAAKDAGAADYSQLSVDEMKVADYIDRKTRHDLLPGTAVPVITWVYPSLESKDPLLIETDVGTERNEQALRDNDIQLDEEPSE